MTPLISIFIFIAVIGIIILIIKYPYKSTENDSNITPEVHPEPVHNSTPELVFSKEPLPIPSQAKDIFVENWTFADFYKKFGPKVKIGKCTNHYTNEEYDCCTFTNNYWDTVFVGFFKQLGSLTKEELVNRRYELFVGKTRSGFYRIYDSNIKRYGVIDEGVDLSKFM